MHGNFGFLVHFGQVGFHGCGFGRGNRGGCYPTGFGRVTGGVTLPNLESFFKPHIESLLARELRFFGSFWTLKESV